MNLSVVGDLTVDSSGTVAQGHIQTVGLPEPAFVVPPRPPQVRQFLLVTAASEDLPHTCRGMNSVNISTVADKGIIWYLFIREDNLSRAMFHGKILVKKIIT